MNSNISLEERMAAFEQRILALENDIKSLKKTTVLKTSKCIHDETVIDWLRDSINNGGFDSGSWAEIVPSTKLYRSYCSWCEVNSIPSCNVITQTSLGNALNALGFLKRASPVNPVFRVFGSIHDAKNVLDNV